MTTDTTEAVLVASEAKILNEKDDQVQNLENELKHLLRRIKHVQDSIQLSSQSTALFNPQTWQENCLHAVRNCVLEYRQILKYYHRIIHIDRHGDDHHRNNGDNVQRDIVNTSSAMKNSVNNSGQPSAHTPVENCHHQGNNENVSTTNVARVALKLFGLIQMSLQVGPLKGSNPGYFKRCGVDVAKMALAFLKECTLGLQERQTSDRSSSINDSCNVCRTTTKNENSGENVEDESDDNQDDKKNELAGIHDDDQLDLHSKKLQELQFTEKQQSIILKWIANAEKAVVANKAPTKSALKLQASSNSKKSQRRKKFQKKKK